MKSLIIGASGFVGGYLIEELKSLHEEIFVTKLPKQTINDVALASSFIDLDITDSEQTKQVIQQISPDTVYHLAAQSSVMLSWDKPQLTADVNIKGAINIFEALKMYCPQCKIVVVGSSEEYGRINYDFPVSEQEYPIPENFYAATKLAQENIARIYSRVYGLNVVLTRSFNHFGPKQSTAFVVADFCNQIAKIEKKKQKAQIHVGNLDAYRDFTDVRDIVKAYVLLARKGAVGEIYNIGRGKAIKIGDILDIILSLTEYPIEVVIDKDKYRPIDIPIICADISKIRKLGWYPEIAITATIKETLNYFRSLY